MKTRNIPEQVKVFDTTPKNRVNDGLNDLFDYRTVFKIQTKDVELLKRVARKAAHTNFSGQVETFGIDRALKIKRVNGGAAAVVSINWSADTFEKTLSKSAIMVEHIQSEMSRMESKISSAIYYGEKGAREFFESV
ncbi:MAG: hypothetical protein KGH71_06080 [Candidatus Micrarchaeota archaeon]|nr:hypothetical protein [Candidatus Micrarchaeota archaeon]